MILTEEEAKAKRCQEGFAGQPPGDGISFTAIAMMAGGIGAITAPSMCLGSKCMAWRWFIDRNKGYCGKAGKP